MYRPDYIEPAAMKKIGFDLVSDKDGYLKYHNNGTYHWNAGYSPYPEPKGKVVVSINTDSNDYFFLGIRQDGNTRTAYNGICDSEDFFHSLLKNVR